MKKKASYLANVKKNILKDIRDKTLKKSKHHIKR